jgi:RNA polymerase sigma-70 factor (ECF subfamily)
MLESPTHSDDDLIRLIKDGDERAFTALYRRHQGPVYRFALQMSGKTEIAEEVTQEVFFFLIRNLKQYDPARGSLASYLLGVARNFVFRCFERDRAYITVIDDPESEHADRIVDTRDVLGDLTRNERIEGLRKAVLALPPNYREVVVLCDLHEMDYAEAAEVLQCAVGTIRSRLHRARTLLMEKMRAGERCPA